MYRRCQRRRNAVFYFSLASLIFHQFRLHAIRLLYRFARFHLQVFLTAPLLSLCLSIFQTHIRILYPWYKIRTCRLDWECILSAFY